MAKKQENDIPRYPEITVELSEQDGNAFSIIGKISRELRRAGVSVEEQKLFQKEATSGDYDHVLQTAFRWVNVS